jgi:glutathione S-transferase
MITLYHSPMTRSGSIVWLLEELDVPYQVKSVDFRRPDGSGARDPSNPHPHGKVPALTDESDTIFESNAITLYLTDKYRHNKLGPLPGEPKRGEYLSWLAYRSGVLEPAILCRRFEVQHVYGAMGWAPADEVEEVLNQHLKTRSYFLGDAFSSVDILLGGSLNFLMTAKMIEETPLLAAYTARIMDRAAYRKMLERDKK